MDPSSPLAVGQRHYPRGCAQQDVGGHRWRSAGQDRLWFFAAGRYLGSDTPQTFVLSDASTTRHDVNKRGEVKFTGSLASGHTVSADYTNNSLVQTNVFSLNSNSLDPSVLISPSTPNTLFVSNYNGVIARQYFAMLQYSQKENAFEGAGGTNPALSAHHSAHAA